MADTCCSRLAAGNQVCELSSTTVQHASPSWRILMRGSKPINARAICETRRVRAVLAMCGEYSKNPNAASHPRPQLERSDTPRKIRVFNLSTTCGAN